VRKSELIVSGTPVDPISIQVDRLAAFSDLSFFANYALTKTFYFKLHWNNSTIFYHNIALILLI